MENVNRRDFLAIEMFKILVDNHNVARDLIKVDDVDEGQFAIYAETLFFMKTAYSLADEMINAAGTRTK